MINQSSPVAAPPAHTLKTENAIRLLAGSLVLISLGLAQCVSPWGLLLALFVSLNLIQSAFTGLCPAERILQRVGVTRDAPPGPPPHAEAAAGRIPAGSPDRSRT